MRRTSKIVRVSIVSFILAGTRLFANADELPRDECKDLHKPTRVLPARLDENVSSNVLPVATPTSELVFGSIFDLEQEGPSVVPQIRRGQKANSADWPASLYVVFNTDKSPTGKGSCTASLIGPQVMLTAAHCIPDSDSLQFTFSGKAYSAWCDRHPNFEFEASADFALCLVASAVETPPGFLFEAVDRSPMSRLVGGRLILAGFGCTTDGVFDPVPDSASKPTYLFGFNIVDETSQSPTRRRAAEFYDAGGQHNNILTQDPGANLCIGDSGGPAFKPTVSGGSILRRKIVGVNSRVLYANKERTKRGASAISATGGPDFLSWAERWTKCFHAEACGIAGSLGNCRG